MDLPRERFRFPTRTCILVISAQYTCPEVTMAIYEYQCDDCKTTFETQQRISEHDDEVRGTPVCPKCDSSSTHRVYASFFAKTSSKT